MGLAQWMVAAVIPAVVATAPAVVADDPPPPGQEVQITGGFVDHRFTYSRDATRRLDEYFAGHSVDGTAIGAGLGLLCSVARQAGPLCAWLSGVILLDYSSAKDNAREAARTGRCFQVVSVNNPRNDGLPYSRIADDDECFG